MNELGDLRFSVPGGSRLGIPGRRMTYKAALVLLFPVIIYLELREKFEKKGRIP